MSVWYMFDNHTFIRLDTLPIDEAIEKVRAASESEGGYGFVSTKHGNTLCPHCGQTVSSKMKDETYQWVKGDQWELKVREMLGGEIRSMAEFKFDYDLYGCGGRAYEDCAAVVVADVPVDWKIRCPAEDEITVKSITIDEDTRKYLTAYYTDFAALEASLMKGFNKEEITEAMCDELDLEHGEGMWDFDAWYGVD